MKEKYLSIITNFGCHGKCPYCIVRENGIRVPKTSIGSLTALSDAIDQTGATIVSVSGGGDPLHRYETDISSIVYYKNLLDILYTKGIPLEMHTSYFDSTFPFGECARVVYHLLDPRDITKIRRRKNEIVRVVFVATHWLDTYTIDWIANYVRASDQIDELSFRQMVDNNYEAQHYNEEHLEKYHGIKWHYIKQADYNLYFVEGKIYTHFKDIEEATY